MDLAYMDNYYEEMIEKIMKEALTEGYWNVEKDYCECYDQFLEGTSETIGQTMEKLMECYQIIEAQILKQMYLCGAIDMEIGFKTGMDIPSSVKALEADYAKSKKQIYSDVSQKLKAREDIHNEWNQKQVAEKQLHKAASRNLYSQYETLMEKRKAVGIVERKCMYLQGALDRARMLS